MSHWHADYSLNHSYLDIVCKYSQMMLINCNWKYFKALRDWYTIWYYSVHWCVINGAKWPKVNSWPKQPPWFVDFLPTLPWFVELCVHHYLIHLCSDSDAPIIWMNLFLQLSMTVYFQYYFKFIYRRNANLLNMQIVKTLISRRILRPLIWICTVSIYARHNWL